MKFVVMEINSVIFNIFCASFQPVSMSMSRYIITLLHQIIYSSQMFCHISGWFVRNCFAIVSFLLDNYSCDTVAFYRF